jgi:hypothetical protein
MRSGFAQNHAMRKLNSVSDCFCQHLPAAQHSAAFPETSILLKTREMRAQAKTLLFAVVMSLVLGLGLFQELHLSKATARRSDPSCDFYFKSKDLCASLEWIKKPTALSEAEFRLKFWNTQTGSPQGPFVAPPGDLRVSLWMPAMGHGTAPVTMTHDKDQSGIVQVSHASFSMKGDWEIWVSLLSGDRFIEKARATYQL